MRIVILGKKDSMKINPVMRVRGLSKKSYPFEWDADDGFYAYRPADQKEVHDIFYTQGKIYRHLRFSVLLDPEPKPEPPKKRGRPRKVVEEEPIAA